ncbi:MAG: hypothetical protein WCF92_04015 [bacterium]
MKNCIYCKAEFTPVANQGNEQNYCSKTCRTKAGNERYKQKLMNNGQQIKSDVLGNIEEKQFVFGNNTERTNFIPDSFRTNVSDTVIRLMEENFKTKSELNAAQLKIEYLEKEIVEFRNEIVELEMELNEEDTEEQKGGIIGMLQELPEWLTPAVGKLLQSEKVLRYVQSMIPETQQTENQ